MPVNRPFVLSIAGLDPSGGAGLLADIKTFEQHKVYGLGVCSALTVQNDREFFSIDWVETPRILDQLDALFRRVKVSACKIGLIRSFDQLVEVVDYIREHQAGTKIVFDPILKASAAKDAFHDPSADLPASLLGKLFSRIDLLTPNFIEMEWLSQSSSGLFDAYKLSEYCAVLVKGGHRPGNEGLDRLYLNGDTIDIAAQAPGVYAKHGSGCVLSASVSAHLASGASLLESCRLAKCYTEVFLNSNDSLLGYHAKN